VAIGIDTISHHAGTLTAAVLDPNRPHDLPTFIHSEEGPGLR